MFRSPHRYIVVQAMVEFIGNAILNGAIGWYWTDGLERVPLFGWLSVASDLAGTCFGIGFVLTLVFTWRFHRRLRGGFTLPIDEFPGRLPSFVGCLPFNPFARGVAVGVVGLAVAGMVVLILLASGAESLGRTDFIVLKTLSAGIVAAASMFMAGYRALGDGVTPERPLGYWPDRHLRRT